MQIFIIKRKQTSKFHLNMKSIQANNKISSYSFRFCFFIILMSKPIFQTSFYLLMIYIFLINIHDLSGYTINNRLSYKNDNANSYEQESFSSEDSPDENQLDNSWHRNVRSNSYQLVPQFDFHRGFIRLIPYKKRTIPLELQKAIYVHGIIGRRR